MSLSVKTITNHPSESECQSVRGAKEGSSLAWPTGLNARGSSSSSAYAGRSFIHLMMMVMVIMLVIMLVIAIVICAHCDCDYRVMQG